MKLVMKMGLGLSTLLQAQLTINREEIGGLLFLAVASALLLVSIIRIRLGRASKTWPVVKGVVIELSWKRKIGFNLFTPSGSMAKKELREGKVPYIKYEYEVNGRVYQSDSINTAPGWLFGPRISARSTKYPQDITVDVYYNPKFPKRAFLEPGVAFFWYISFFFGVIGLIGSLMYFLG